MPPCLPKGPQRTRAQCNFLKRISRGETHRTLTITSQTLLPLSLAFLLLFQLLLLEVLGFLRAGFVVCLKKRVWMLAIVQCHGGISCRGKAVERRNKSRRSKCSTFHPPLLLQRCRRGASARAMRCDAMHACSYRVPFGRLRGGGVQARQQ